MFILFFEHTHKDFVVVIKPERFLPPYWRSIHPKCWRFKTFIKRS